MHQKVTKLKNRAWKVLLIIETKLQKCLHSNNCNENSLTILQIMKTMLWNAVKVTRAMNIASLSLKMLIMETMIQNAVKVTGVKNIPWKRTGMRDM